jgi:AcrR family transcriptional regulator
MALPPTPGTARGKPGRPAAPVKAATPRGARRRSVIAPGDTAPPNRRQDILTSAEELFAELGYHAVSVRDIAARAGVPLALVGYYFGKKEELLGTIFEHRRGYIDERLQRIAAVDCSPANPNAVEDLVHAWVEPAVVLRATEGGAAFSRLVARLSDQGPEADRVIEPHYDPLARTFIAAMEQALPGCDRNLIVWGYVYALGALLKHISDVRVERLSDGDEVTADPARMPDLVRFLTAGFRALAAGASR